MSTSEPPPVPGPDGLPAPGRAGRRGGRPPAPLVAAVVLVALEALALVLEGVYEVGVLSSSRATMGVTTALFFVVYGVGLGACGWQLYRLRSWARAPVVLAQLIQLLVAVSFWGGSTTPVAVALVLVALLTLVGVFHPASIAALDTADREAG